MTTAEVCRVELVDRLARVPGPVLACAGECAALGVAELLALGRNGCARCGATPVAPIGGA